MNARFSSRRLAAAAPILALCWLFSWAGWGRADAPPERRRMENRFLFVIDTSSAMRDRSNGVQRAVTGLLDSGMNGELRKGDTIGIWTYSDTLNTDYPMTVWSEGNKDQISKDAAEYLSGLSYGKRSRLDKALPAIHQVMAGSERMTAIFIFDGADSIKGTPFDRDIHDLHKQYARAFRSAREPFVTILAARNGAVFDYTINYPTAVTVPHTADPLPPPETNVPPPVAVSAPPAPRAANPPAETNQPPRKIEIILSGSNFTHNASAPPPDAGNVAVVVTPAPAQVVVTNPPAAAEARPAAVQAAPEHVTPAAGPVVASPVPVVARAPMPVVTPAPAPSFRPVAAAAAAPVMDRAVIYVIALSLLTIAVALVLLVARRSRGGSRTSLISEAIDRSR